MAAVDRPGKLLLATLFVLTVVSGLVDALSYLGLGHVFTANMTGNVVVLGFAAAGASGFSAAACLTSLGTFVVGAAAAGRAARVLTSRRTLLFLAMTTEGLVTAAATIIALAAPSVSTGWARFTVISVLAFGMGVRNSTIRRLAVPDLTTTVLTLTLTGLAADSALAGGTNQNTIRRSIAVAAMLAGAFAGAYSFLHASAGITLLIATIIVLGSALLFWSAGESRLLDKSTKVPSQ